MLVPRRAVASWKRTHASCAKGRLGQVCGWQQGCQAASASARSWRLSQLAICSAARPAYKGTAQLA